MNYPSTDPSEWVGTTEYEELREERHRLRVLMLELQEEEEATLRCQYPHRFSH